MNIKNVVISNLIGIFKVKGLFDLTESETELWHLQISAKGSELLSADETWLDIFHFFTITTGTSILL